MRGEGAHTGWPSFATLSPTQPLPLNSFLLKSPALGPKQHPMPSPESACPASHASRWQPIHSQVAFP